MFKRIITVAFFILISTIGKAQEVDSIWLADTFLKQFHSDTGIYLPKAKFIDVKGKTKTLDDFRGKIVYMNVWDTDCGNSIEQFPYEDQLLKRLKVIHLDSSIQIINLCTSVSKKEWKKVLKKYHPVGVNLYCTDTTLYTRWNIEAWPNFILLDTSGKVMGKKITDAATAIEIDYILYAATKGIHPVEAVWKNFRQGQLMSEYKTPSAFTDEDYAKWYFSLQQNFIEFHFWKQEQTKQKNKAQRGF